MRFRDAENWVVEDFGREYFGPGVERLIDSLMSWATGDQWDFSCDGIFCVSEQRSEAKYRGVGSAVFLPDQHSEPVMFAFELDEKREFLASAELKIGSCGSSRKPDQGDRNRIENAFLIDPNAEFDWIRVFNFDGDAWSINLPNFVPKG